MLSAVENIIHNNKFDINKNIIRLQIANQITNDLKTLKNKHP